MLLPGEVIRSFTFHELLGTVSIANLPSIQIKDICNSMYVILIMQTECLLVVHSSPNFVQINLGG